MENDALDALRQQNAAADKAAVDLAELAKKAVEHASAAGDPSLTGQVWDGHTVLILSGAILLFGLIALVIMAYLFTKHPKSPMLLSAFALPLIIISAIFLVVTGYSQEQIAPVIGLLGTIAGYLLGRNERELLASQMQPTSTPGGNGKSTVTTTIS